MSGRDHRTAALLVRIATRLMPPQLRHWGAAMQHELGDIEDRGEALGFALGCLQTALRTAIGTRHSKWGEEIMADGMMRRPERAAAAGAIAATALGMAYMGMTGAPANYLVLNAVALAIGFLAVGIVTLLPRPLRPGEGATCLLLGAMLLAVSLFGTTAGGATRWVSVAGLSVQPSLIVLPVLAIGFARSRDALALAGVVIAATGLALQPDRAMAGALAAGMLALAALRPERNSLVAAAAAALAVAVTMARPDVQPAMPYVDQILYSSFAFSLPAGLAVAGGLALMIVPALIGAGRDAPRRDVHLTFGAVWLAIIVAAALGNYPTPLVGYGGSAILGYVLCLLALRRDRESTAGTSDSAPASEGASEDILQRNASPAL